MQSATFLLEFMRGNPVFTLFVVSVAAIWSAGCGSARWRWARWLARCSCRCSSANTTSRSLQAPSPSALRCSSSRSATRRARAFSRCCGRQGLQYLLLALFVGGCWHRHLDRGRETAGPALRWHGRPAGRRDDDDAHAGRRPGGGAFRHRGPAGRDHGGWRARHHRLELRDHLRGRAARHHRHRAPAAADRRHRPGRRSRKDGRSGEGGARRADAGAGLPRHQCRSLPVDDQGTAQSPVGPPVSGQTAT